jgi:protein-arginine kinase activator protein McsA
MTFNYKLSTLEKRLAGHIANEQYEDAAKVRDAIRDLKEQYRKLEEDNTND